MAVAFETLRGLLHESGLVSDDELALVKDEIGRTGRTAENVLIGRGFIAENYLLEILAPYYQAPIVDLKAEAISQETLNHISEQYAKAHGVVIFAEDTKKGIAKVAMLDPDDCDTIEFLRAKLGLWVEPYICMESGLRYALKQYKNEVVGEFNDIIAQNVDKSLLYAHESDLSKIAAAVPIITILNSIIEQAISMDASDIHFEPLEQQTLVRFRVDGILQEILSLPKQLSPLLAARVKILAELRIDEHRTPQDGRFHFELDDGTSIDVRTNIMPVFDGEKVEMRLLKSSARPLTLTDLGLSKEGHAIIDEEIKKPHGMIVVTGPTGHGKTTTLYAILNILNTPKVNITTIEDPIEYQLPRVNQTQVNPKAGITFGNGLRALLRQNPDIIMIGEIRDDETVEIAIQSALTGHLLLSSLHTNDAPSAIPRFIDMGAQPFLLSSVINLIVAQRLVRKICTSCVESYEVSEDVRKMIAEQAKFSGEENVKKLPKVFYRSKGCRVCGNTGFRGQIGVFELLRMSDTIRQMILRSAPASEIRAAAIKEGMLTMFKDGLMKAEEGITTVEEVLRVVRE